MTKFILNRETIESDLAAGMPLLDFIREKMSLTATKTGCREGDCGACTVLEGTLVGNKVEYKSIVSCLTPLANAHGKHIVTLEGINMDELTHVQEAMHNHAATQCGFCTPGFVMSFTAHSMAPTPSDTGKAIDAVSGNICRCTGYKSIERAASDISKRLEGKDIDAPVEWLVRQKLLPNYFLDIPQRLKNIQSYHTSPKDQKQIIAGGTDLMVQRSLEIMESDMEFIRQNEVLKFIKIANNEIHIGAAVSAGELAADPIMHEFLPKIHKYFRLISSEPIRNMGTIAGNIMNASPIGDLSILFLALDASLHLSLGEQRREIKLNKFFLDYKKTAIKKGELIESLSFTKPVDAFLFNFEKVSKRTHLDIASVSSAVCIEMEHSKIRSCRISAGGVKAIPFFLEKCSNSLIGKEISTAHLKEALDVMETEIAPISDIRGSAEYKKLLLRQLIQAHFYEMFPQINEQPLS